MRDTLLDTAWAALRDIVEEQGPSPRLFLATLETLSEEVSRSDGVPAIRYGMMFMLAYALRWPEHAKAVQLSLDRGANAEDVAYVTNLLRQLVEICPISVTLDPL